MKKLTNILIVTSEFPPEPGGIGNHAYNLAKELSLNSFEVSVVTDQRDTTILREKEFDSELPFVINRIPIKKIRFLMYLNRVLKIFDTISKNHTIIASGKFSLWIVAFATLFYKRNYIAVIHGFEVNFKNNWLKKITDNSLKRFHKIIAVSNFTKSLINHLNLKNIEVIPNGFQISSFKSKIKKKNVGSPSLITIGSVTERKGQKNVIKALPKLLIKFPKLMYHVVGTPFLKDEFIKIAQDLDVDKHIIFHGKVNEKKKYELLNRSDIFIMLSENTTNGDVEGFGIALIEANSLGIPAIGAKDCGIEDAIKNYSSGILVDRKNAIEFGKAIKIILNDYENYQNNSKIWASNFTWDLIIKKYIKTILN